MSVLANHVNDDEVLLRLLVDNELVWHIRENVHAVDLYFAGRATPRYRANGDGVKIPEKLQGSRSWLFQR